MVVLAIIMAVPFYLPDGGDDDALSMGADASSNDTGSGGSSMQSSPHTTSSSTQTPMHSPLASNDILMAFCEAFYRYSVNNGVNIFHYPMPSSAPCSLHSPSYTSGGDVFFPRSRSTQRTPRTSFSYNGGEEANFLLLQSPTVAGPNTTQTTQTQTNNTHPHPQSYLAQGGHQRYHQHPHFCQHTHMVSYHNPNANGTYCQHTPPSTPTVNTAGVITSTGAAYRHYNGCHSDPAMRCRLTSTGEEENECQYEHNTNWDELHDRYENFTAGREHLQEFSGQIPPSKKKKDIVKAKSEKKAQSLTWPAVVTVFVFAMGCGFLVAR